MKLIAGVLQPTHGQICIDGKAVFLNSPKAALSHGLVCMFQELSLVPDLTVRENLLLGAPGAGIGWLRSEALAKAQDVLARIEGKSIKMGARVADLTLPQRQQVEIAKAMMKRPRLLILDEATSALGASVVERVFDLVREERDNGTGRRHHGYCRPTHPDRQPETGQATGHCLGLYPRRSQNRRVDP